jgi:hypothetical protein
MRWSQLHGDMQGRLAQGPFVRPRQRVSGKALSEIPCRVRKLAPPSRERRLHTGSYRGSPHRLVAAGNPEGSPRDPLTTDPKGEACRAPDVPEIHAMRNTPALIDRQGAYGAVVPLDPWYVTGLAEGEGCFCVSIAIRRRLRTGLEVRPSFALSLNERDVDLLRGLQAFFGCGWIRESRGDRTFKFEVRSTGELVSRVLPHFERYPLRGCKAKGCAGLRHVCRMIEQGDHLQRNGMREIIDVAHGMNVGKRRHSRDKLLRVLDEVKV